MGFACAPQILGLVRGEPKPNAKHRANGRAIFAEMGEERISTSDTFDKSRSHMNEYEFLDGLSSSGFQCWDYVEERANNYKVKALNKKKEPVERALRGDAVVGFAVIMNPPEEVCVSWTDDDYEKFYNDTWDYLEQKEPRIFRRENIVIDAEHYDEGYNQEGKSRHMHIGGEARDEDGKYCGNLIDAKLLSEINKEYPSFMRAHGWDMDDLDCTDWDRYKTDKEYREERKAKSKKNGLSVNKHLKQKGAEQRIAQENALRELEIAQAEALAQERDELHLETQQEYQDCNEELDAERADVWLEHKQNERDRKQIENDMARVRMGQKQIISDREKLDDEIKQSAKLYSEANEMFYFVEDAKKKVKSLLASTEQFTSDRMSRMEQFMSGFSKDGRTLLQMFQAKEEREKSSRFQALDEISSQSRNAVGSFDILKLPPKARNKFWAELKKLENEPEKDNGMER